MRANKRTNAQTYMHKERPSDRASVFVRPSVRPRAGMYVCMFICSCMYVGVKLHVHDRPRPDIIEQLRGDPL